MCDLLTISKYGYYDNMELAKHGTTDENSVKRYISPKATVIFVKAQKFSA